MKPLLLAVVALALAPCASAEELFPADESPEQTLPRAHFLLKTPGRPLSLEDLRACDRAVRAAIEKALRKPAVTKDPNWASSLAAVVEEAGKRAEEAAEGESPSLESVARCRRIAADAAGALSPERLAPMKLMEVTRARDEALRAYFASEEVRGLAPEDLLDPAVKWTADEGLVVSRTDGAVEISNRSGRAALFMRLEGGSDWRDYDVSLEAAFKGPFQVQVRIAPELIPGATADFEQFLNEGLIREDVAEDLGISVFGNRFTARAGASRGKPIWVAPAGSRAGGIAIRVPAGTTVRFTRIQVRVLR